MCHVPEHNAISGCVPVAVRNVTDCPVQNGTTQNSVRTMYCLSQENSWCKQHNDVTNMATFVFKCGNCGVFFATLPAMQAHLCPGNARKTNEAPQPEPEEAPQPEPEDNEEVILPDLEVNSEQPTHASVESTQVSWSKAATKLLITEMIKYKEKLNAGAIKKKPVMNMICQKLRQNNYLFTEDQVTGRWKTLVGAYKAVKDGQNKSGSGRKTYEFQQDLDEYFQGDLIVKPLAVATSGSSSTVNKTAVEEESDESVESQPKRKRNSASGELVSVLKTYMASQDEQQKKELERREKMHEEKMTLII